jgi:isopenicillin N synthase-like dioxygenase
LLRLFHYPADNNTDPSLWAVGEHTDYGLITILLITDKGLQVKSKQNEWINIDPIPGTFVVNIGDILERITGGLYKSTPHRAKNTQGVSRYSIPYFFDPDWDAEISVMEFKVTEEERKIQEATNSYKRWDEADLSYLKGFYGDYLLSKVSKAFPQLASETL